MTGLCAYHGPEIFDGFQRFTDHALVVAEGRVSGIVPNGTLGDIQAVHLTGGVLCPGFVDLQVNGGGGVMFNDNPSPETLRLMSAAHARLGTTSLLPTLITDSAEKTAAAIDAVAAGGVSGIVGLHLEGPHIALSRKGAHEARHIRAMTGGDLAELLAASRRLPRLKVTLAPEAVTLDQIAALSEAGVLVSLGHSDATFDEAAEAVRAGARCATHLFNAMSALGSRAPGLVGAALELGQLSAGIIADGIHVHPASVGTALRAKRAPGQIFLVSDAMAVAGTAETSFELNGRRVMRRDGRLTLADGTLSGADLDLVAALRNLLRWHLVPVDTALAMASRMPAELAGLPDGIGTLRPGAVADFVHVDPETDGPVKVWKAGQPV